MINWRKYDMNTFRLKGNLDEAVYEQILSQHF